MFILPDSLYGVNSMPWMLIMPTFTYYVGRRIPFIIASFVMIVTFMILFFSTSISEIIIAEIMQGYFHACLMTVAIPIVSEYTSPKYRGVFLTIKSASVFWGIWIANTIGTFFHWKYIAAIGIMCCCHNFTSFLWPESPYWLASRGRFEDCVISYRWLHGSTEESERELTELIKNQSKYLKSQNKASKSFNFVQYTKKEFYKPLLLMMVALTQYHFSGKLVCSIYILEILKKITQSESTAYTGMLILDGVTLLGMYTGCILSKFLRRRTLYLGSSALGVIFLFLISLYLYLVNVSLIDENKCVSILLLTCFSVSIGCGPMIMMTTIYGEIIPTKYKQIQTLITALTYAAYSTGMLKLAPLLFSAMGHDGTFLIYGIMAGFCTFLLYLYMPETKDKTLMEIEGNFEVKTQEDTPQSSEEFEQLVANRSKLLVP